jgi:uncharacterized protein DUF4136
MKMDIRACFFALIIAASFPTPSKSQTVTYNYAQSVNFAVFKTYQWVSIGGVSAADPVLERNIQAAIDTQLGSIGLVKTHEVPQLLIAYQVSIDREGQITLYQRYSSYGPGWSEGYGYGYSHGYTFDCPYSLSTETGSTIQIGHLILDIYDSAYQDLVWRGRVSQAISFSEDPNKRQQRLNKAVAKLIKAYPRKPKE